MKKLFVSILFLVIICGASCAVDIGATKQATPISRELDLLYRKAMSRESLRSYDDALYAYNVILARVQALVNSKRGSDDSINSAMPYAIASAYRKSIVTQRSIEGAVVKLYNQLKLYEDTEKWINEVLTEISNIEFERGIKLPESQYGMLYWARAYNKMGWAYALYNGNYWKRYLIYTPADTVLMVDKAMDDLQKMANIYKGYVRSGGVGAAAEASVDFADDSVSAYELVTYSLCYNSEDTAKIKNLMGRQYDGSVAKTLKLYDSPAVEGNLNAGRKIFSYEDMMTPKSRDVAVSMGEMLRGMGKY